MVTVYFTNGLDMDEGYDFQKGLNGLRDAKLVTIKRNDALDALSRFLRQRDLDLEIGKATNFMISHEPG